MLPEVEVRLEALRLEPDRALVERLGLDHLVARVVQVGEVDDPGDEIGIDHQRPPIGRRRLLHRPLVAIVQARGLDEVLRGELSLRIGEREPENPSSSRPRTGAARRSRPSAASGDGPGA